MRNLTAQTTDEIFLKSAMEKLNCSIVISFKSFRNDIPIRTKVEISFGSVRFSGVRPNNEFVFGLVFRGAIPQSHPHSCADDFVALVRTVGPSEYSERKRSHGAIVAPWVRTLGRGPGAVSLTPWKGTDLLP